MPCKKGMTGCKVGCRHRTMVDDYRIARHNEELQREAVCLGGKEEERDYPRLITFGDWMRGYWEPNDGRNE